VRPRALIDISDGLSSEVHHLCRNSGCGAFVRGEAIPVHPETRVVADERMEDVDTFALFGGEDYELLFALDPGDVERLDSDSFAIIGAFTAESDGVNLITADGETVPLGASGYEHLSGEVADDDGLELGDGASFDAP
jgi:thiamine-monophosphate kinase